MTAVLGEAPGETSGELTLADIFRLTLRSWKLIAACIVVSAAVGVAYTLTRSPLYRAEVLLAPAEPTAAGGLGGLAKFASQFGGLASLAGVDLDSSGSTRVISVATLGSRKFLEKFIDDHQLMQKLYADRWNAQTKTFEPSMMGRVPTIDDALKYINTRVLSIEEDRKTGLIRLQITWGDPKVAADWANELVKRVNEATRGDALQEADRAIAYLTAESQRAQAIGLQQSIYRLIEVQMNKATLARARDDFAFRVIDPAVAPAISNFYWPRRRLMVMLFMFCGAVVGGVAALTLGLRGKRIF
jgi:uncharacterized protein involved in exopolysaccharide biosynthesis